MDFESVLITIGTVASIFTGLTFTVTIYSNKKSKISNFLPLNFLRLGYACQLTWLIYSFMVNIFSLILINIITSIITSTNLLLYLSITESSPKILSEFFILNALMLGIMAVLRTTENIGYLASALNVFTFITSFESMYKAITYRNKGFIEIKSTVVCCFNSVIWTLIGLSLGDSNVIFSSGLATLITLLSITVWSVLSLI